MVRHYSSVLYSPSDRFPSFDHVALSVDFLNSERIRIVAQVRVLILLQLLHILLRNHQNQLRLFAVLRLHPFLSEQILLPLVLQFNPSHPWRPPNATSSLSSEGAYPKDQGASMKAGGSLNGKVERYLFSGMGVLSGGD